MSLASRLLHKLLTQLFTPATRRASPPLPQIASQPPAGQPAGEIRAYPVRPVNIVAAAIETAEEAVEEADIAKARAKQLEDALRTAQFFAEVTERANAALRAEIADVVRVGNAAMNRAVEAEDECEALREQLAQAEARAALAEAQAVRTATDLGTALAERTRLLAALRTVRAFEIETGALCTLDVKTPADWMAIRTAAEAMRAALDGVSDLLREGAAQAEVQA